MCVCVCVCLHVSAHWLKASDTLELKLQVVVSYLMSVLVLVIKPGPLLEQQLLFTA